MLKKLFFYHFKAILRHNKWPLISLPIGAATAFVILMLGILIPEASGAFDAINYGLTAIVFLVVTAFVGLLGYCLVQLFLHHYRSFFGRSAAFIRMIPAKGRQHLAASLLSGVLWMLILLGVLVLSALLGILLHFLLVE